MSVEWNVRSESGDQKKSLWLSRCLHRLEQGKMVVRAKHIQPLCIRFKRSLRRCQMSSGRRLPGGREAVVPCASSLSLCVCIGQWALLRGPLRIGVSTQEPRAGLLGKGHYPAKRESASTTLATCLARRGFGHRAHRVVDGCLLGKFTERANKGWGWVAIKAAAGMA